eukprot:2705-Heterococcus_DN1.PRE.4
MIRQCNKRILDNADSEYNAKIQRVDDAALPQWLRVERAVFSCPDLFGPDVCLLLHWDEMSFNQFMAVGFIEIYPDARQFCIEMFKASPAQQFGFVGAVFCNGRWCPVQVKDHIKPISPNDLGSFFLASNYIRYECITINAAEILSRIPPAPVLQHTTDIDCINLLRPCQQRH